MNISLRHKYSAAFILNALLLLVVAFVGQGASTRTEAQLQNVSNTLLPAITAALSADKVLYEAQMASLELLNDFPGSDEAEQKKQRFDSNAAAAKQLMLDYKSLLKDEPKALSGLDQFDTSFELWVSETQVAFEMFEQYDQAGALVQILGPGYQAFSELKQVYVLAHGNAERFVSQIEQRSAEEIEQSNTLMLVISVAAVLFAVLIAYFWPRSLANAITDISARIRDISSGDGDLTQRVSVKNKDELGELATAFNQFISHLQSIIVNVRDHSDKVSSEIFRLESKANESTEISIEQHASVEQIVTAVNQMAVTHREVAANAANTADEISNVNSKTQQGQAITQDSVEQINALASSVANAAQAVQAVVKDSDNIAQVLGVIRGIADQTNLLALNAAIEAARAGEQGRGFAVVADEVRNLASKTQDSTQSIEAMIEALKLGVSNAVESIESGATVAQRTIDLAEQTQVSLSDILSSTAKVSDDSMSIATSTEQQSQVTQDIDKNLIELNDKTRMNQEMANETRDIASSVKQTASSLNLEIQKFKVI
ncbi:methyl-accepting chemotaxis protein [Alginatibacterium sediminis]|uniref:Methyl-accepting chemotaxis protein n=1 Tax=Alginatibacterium sediminis TaxID=2164068 RepID=A0A420EHJ9_9ALTE|nr:methyl-accepting chemotaxis protein [Alginatibacterium sediminis]RKF20185.1 methyl-accepting chemotaxis protein [Alginatibacterium sediminis]